MKIDISKPCALKYPCPTMETVINNFFVLISFYSLINIAYDEDTDKAVVNFINQGLYNILIVKKDFIYPIQSPDVIFNCLTISSSSIYEIVKDFSRNFYPSNKVYLDNKKLRTKILFRLNYEKIQNK
jgi:hypothetical protein